MTYVQGGSYTFLALVGCLEKLQPPFPVHFASPLPSHVHFGVGGAPLGSGETKDDEPTAGSRSIFLEDS